MDLFTKTGAVKLRSHLDKYLVADDDRKTARQIRNGAAARARWSVEPVEGRADLVRLRSCHGRYLAASDEPFLLGMTGKKVLQALPGEGPSSSWTLEWEPIRDGFQVKLRSWCGKYLRANGGPPPWRNSVTHNDPLAGGTQNWVLWDVEAVAGSADWEAPDEYSSAYSSFSSSVGGRDDDVAARSEVVSPTAVAVAPSKMEIKQWFPSMSGIARAQGEEAKKAAAIDQVVEGLSLLEDAVGKISKGKPFFGGDTIGFLDIALGCFLGWVRVTERTQGLKLLDQAKIPGLAKWAERFCADSAVKGVMPETEKLAEFAKLIMAKFRAPPPQ
ncbi:hypothetical protein ACJRO7_011938 [Eucalyptus globulus]|uniref:glutathione transferase n=1 Tax=Eucalyptus globulus TaxID=34317 RepID=A0ABD3LMI7_EUCGL